MKKRLFFLLCVLGAACIFAQEKSDVKRNALITAALKYVGVPYAYGSESPAAFDCSGFVRYVFREVFALELPRRSMDYLALGMPVDPDDARKGDIFIYDTVGGKPSHVAIYMGDGKIIHAASSGPATGVIISLITDKYWAARFIAARSMPSANEMPQPSAVIKAAEPSTKSAAEKSKPVDIRILIPASPEAKRERISMALGAAVVCTLTNGSGKDGTFIIAFSRSDSETFKQEAIRNEKVTLAAKGAKSLSVYVFGKEGTYSLVIKDTWGKQLAVQQFVVRKKP